MDGNGPDAELFFGISYEDFQRQRLRRFGTANPDPMEVPLWNAIIRHGYPTHFSQRAFQEDDYKGPIWVPFGRFGASITHLPDGRIVFIGGEYEDAYDPCFCIYNDVIVSDGSGNCEIYGYPKHDFPPTDFHTATLVGDYNHRIIIIGGLGYAEDRIPGVTNVFAPSDTGERVNYPIHPVKTAGDNPGWIWKHRAILSVDGGSIIVFGGDALDANEAAVPMDDVYSLNLSTLIWERVGHLPARELLRPISTAEREKSEMEIFRAVYGYQGPEESLTENQRKRVMLQHALDMDPPMHDEAMLAELKQMLAELGD